MCLLFLWHLKERKLKDLQQKYEESIKQNELLKSEIEELKTAKKSNEKYAPFYS